MPVVLNLRAVGYGIAQAREDLANLVTHQRNGMPRTKFLLKGGAGEVATLGGSYGCVVELLFESCNALVCAGLHSVDLLTEHTFLLGGYGFELLQDIIQFALTAEDFYTEVLNFGSGGGLELFNSIKQVVDFFD